MGGARCRRGAKDRRRGAGIGRAFSLWGRGGPPWGETRTQLVGGPASRKRITFRPQGIVLWISPVCSRMALEIDALGG